MIQQQQQLHQQQQQSARRQLDLLFAIDASVSVGFGILSLLAPHGILAHLGAYNHDVHELLR